MPRGSVTKLVVVLLKEIIKRVFEILFTEEVYTSDTLASKVSIGVANWTERKNMHTNLLLKKRVSKSANASFVFKQI